MAYGKLEEIRQVPGVKAVYLETRYEPMTQADTSNVVAQQMTGAASVQQDAGYTGARGPDCRGGHRHGYGPPVLL